MRMANKPTATTAEKLATIQQGYTLEGATIELGAAIVDGEIHKEAQVRLPLAMMNRHGLVAGATGTGKTVTLHMIAEQLCTAGVPVFLADIKGDLSGLATPATGSEKLTARTSRWVRIGLRRIFRLSSSRSVGTATGSPPSAPQLPRSAPPSCCPASWTSTTPRNPASS